MPYHGKLSFVSQYKKRMSMHRFIIIAANLLVFIFCSCHKDVQKPQQPAKPDTAVITRWVCLNRHTVASGYLSGVKMPRQYYYFSGLPNKIDFRKDSSYAFKTQSGGSTDSVYCKGPYRMYKDSVIIYDTRKYVIDGCKKLYGTDVAFSVIYFKSNDSLIEAKSAQLWSHEICSDFYDGFFYSGQYRIEYP